MNFWQRFLQHDKRLKAEMMRVDLEMAKKNATRARQYFPRKSYKASTILLFSVFGFLTAIAAWALLKDVLPSFR